MNSILHQMEICKIRKHNKKINKKNFTFGLTFLVGGTLGGLKKVASRGLTAVGSSGIAAESLDTSLISV